MCRGGRGRSSAGGQTVGTGFGACIVIGKARSRQRHRTGGDIRAQSDKGRHIGGAFGARHGGTHTDQTGAGRLRSTQLADVRIGVHRKAGRGDQRTVSDGCRHHIRVADPHVGRVDAQQQTAAGCLGRRGSHTAARRVRVRARNSRQRADIDAARGRADLHTDPRAGVDCRLADADCGSCGNRDTFDVGYAFDQRQCIDVECSGIQVNAAHIGGHAVLTGTGTGVDTRDRAAGGKTDQAGRRTQHLNLGIKVGAVHRGDCYGARDIDDIRIGTAGDLGCDGTGRCDLGQRTAARQGRARADGRRQSRCPCLDIDFGIVRGTDGQVGRCHIRAVDRSLDRVVDGVLRRRHGDRTCIGDDACGHGHGGRGDVGLDRCIIRRRDINRLTGRQDGAVVDFGHHGIVDGVHGKGTGTCAGHTDKATGQSNREAGHIGVDPRQHVCRDVDVVAGGQGRTTDAREDARSLGPCRVVLANLVFRV